MSSKAAFVGKVSELLDIAPPVVEGCFENVKEKFGIDSQFLLEVLEEHYENLLNNYDHYLISFPPELKELIVKDFPVKDIVSFCSSSRYLQEICQDEHLWRALFLRDFHSDYFSDNPKEDYKKAYVAMRFLKKVNELINTGSGLTEEGAMGLVNTIARSIFELVTRGVYDTPCGRSGYQVKDIPDLSEDRGSVFRLIKASMRFEEAIAENLLKFYLDADTPYEIIAAHFWGSEGFFFLDKPDALGDFLFFFSPAADNVVDMNKLSSDITKIFLFVKWLSETIIRKDGGKYKFTPIKQMVDYAISTFYEKYTKEEIEKDKNFTKLREVFRSLFLSVDTNLMHIIKSVCPRFPQSLQVECRKLIEEKEELKERLKRAVEGIKGYESSTKSNY